MRDPIENTPQVQPGNKPGFFGLLVLFSLPFILPMFTCFLSGDDLMNLFYYTSRPSWMVLRANIFFWTSFHRPLGGALYLLLYRFFGLNPFPYHFTAFLIYAANLALLYWLFLKISGKPRTSLIAAALGSIHLEFMDIWFNFGAVYELLCFGLMMASFHFYIRHLERSPGDRRFYILSLVAFVLALDSKEMAVAIPAIFALYEIVYRIPRQSFFQNAGKMFIRLIPFLLATLLYTLGKIFGAESYWKDNSSYRYRFDSTLLNNLRIYLEKTLHRTLNLQDWMLFAFLAATIAIALLLRNKEMIFGWFYFLIALFPVLPLPRNWGLFLYIPMPGISLYAAALLFEVLKWIGELYLRLSHARWRPGPGLKLAGVIVLLAAMLQLQYRGFSENRRTLYLEPEAVRRVFASELFALCPIVSPKTAMIFQNSPWKDYDLSFLIWLRYKNNQIKVYRSPEDNDALLNLGSLSEYRAFRFENEKLTEVRLKDVVSRKP